MKQFLSGKKTYISLAVLLSGVLGLSQYVSSQEIAVIFDAAFELIGTIGVIYGRAVAQAK